jgi:RimJ/RimL family protein N-acetyltransferase
MIGHPLESQRLLLLPPAPDEAPALLEAMQSSLADLSAWAVVTDGLATPYGVQQLISRARRRIEDGTHLYWRLWTQLPLCLIGSVSVHTIDREAGSAELGYWLRRTATGNGYATEACHRVLQFLFELPEFAHIAVRCDSRNDRALRVAHRLVARWPCRHEVVTHGGHASMTEVFRFSSDIPVCPDRPALPSS